MSAGRRTIFSGCMLVMGKCVLALTVLKTTTGNACSVGETYYDVTVSDYLL